MKKNKLIKFLLPLLLLSGCSETTYVNMDYYNQMKYEEDAKFSTINESIFYRNDYQYGKNLQGADPSIMKITDENDPDYGYY